MPLYFGQDKAGSLYLGSTKIGSAYMGNVKVYDSTPADPYNPLGLPAYTIRCQFQSGYDPSSKSLAGFTWTLVDAPTNVWDGYKPSNNWYSSLGSKLVSVLGANTSDVIYMTNVFDGCSNLTSVALFDTSRVTTTSGLFENCTSLTSVPLYDLSNVGNTTGMFWQCTNLASVPAFNLSSATDLSSMFYYCSSLTTAPSLILNVNSNVKAYSLFANCANLTTVPLLNTTHVTNMQQMFNRCTSLRTVPLLDTSHVVNMNSMFEGCSSLTAVPLFDTSHVKYMSGTFEDCSAVSSGALALYTQASTQTNPPTSHYNTFASCGSSTVTGRADLDAIPTDWGGNRRLWQNDYFIELTSSSADDMHFCGLVFNGSRNRSISSGKYTNDNTTWTQLTSSDLSTLNTYSGPDWYANAMTAQFYFSANGDPVPSCYFISGDSSTVPSMSITATLYGKRVGENTWTSITSKSYTQRNGYQVYLLS